jgi:arabinose-5-phosphate isomerase
MQHLAEIEVISLGASVFYKQAESLNQIGGNLGHEFFEAVQTLYNTSGRVVVSGMGKSGHIGRKIAATLASTGTPSFFVHPAEAFHGDLGMITAQDTVVLLSNSGKTEEIVRLLPYLQEINVPIIAICGIRDSTLGQESTVVLEVPVGRETCPNNLAPTTSTTATLAMGDALAVALIKLRQFEPKDFARFHPGGSLGRMLLTRVQDVMTTSYPEVLPSATFTEVIAVMTKGCMGLALVMQHDQVLGIITDGDVRRALDAYNEKAYHLCAEQMMSAPPITIQANAKLEVARQIMNSHQVTALVVQNDQDHCIGVLKLHDAR